MRAYIACSLVFAALDAPSTAQASPGGEVTAVEAELDVREPERAHVTLALRVRVESGWLSRLELDGLDPDAGEVAVKLAPDWAPPELHAPAPGQLVLRWIDRAGAPAPGEHALRVAYTTRRLRPEDASLAPRRVDWTLPRWRERVAGAQIRVLGPPGLIPLPAAEPNLGLSVALDRERGSITYTRVELPRTEAWLVSFELPPAAKSGETPLAHLRETGLAELRSALDESVWLGLLGACLGLLVVAKRRLRRSEPAGTALVPALEAERFDALSFALCALSAVLLQEAPSLALACALAGVASGLERGERKARRALAAVSGERPRWFDATTLAGASLLAVLYLAGSRAPEAVRGAALTCVWLATPLFFSRTRFHA